MTVTTLDPTTALIVVDLQKGVVSLPGGAPRIGETSATQDVIHLFKRGA